MDFKLISKSDIPLLLAKYGEEILKIEGQYDSAEKTLEKYLSKVLKQDLSIQKGNDFQKSYCMKVKDSFQARKLSCVIFINETSFNQLKFKLNIKKAAFQMFLGFHQDLINYLKKEVLGNIFPEQLILNSKI